MCDKNWPSAAAMLRHRKCHRRNNNEVQFDDAESREGEINIGDTTEAKDDDRMPVANIFDWLCTPFTEDAEI